MNTAAIIDSIDQAISETALELDRLKAARLALTVAPAARAVDAPAKAVSPRPAPKPRKKGGERMPKLTREVALAGIKDQLADGPMKTTPLMRGLGYGLQATGAKNVVRQALEELRAEQTKDGWALPDHDADPAEAQIVAQIPAPENRNGNGNGHQADRTAEDAYLERQLLKALGGVDEPLTSGGIGVAIGCSATEASEACSRLAVVGEVVKWSDGRWSLAGAT